MNIHFQRVQKIVGQDASIRSGERGFTMVEIALCLAIIGFALVAIIGVLPIGMSVQKDNRESTIINFDAKNLVEAIRSGGKGFDDLTNYIVQIDITNASYDYKGNLIPKSVVRSHFANVTNNIFQHFTILGSVNIDTNFLTNGYNIVGLLSRPKYEIYPTYYTSNSVVAIFRGLTGSAMDQATNQTSRDFAFQYQVRVELLPQASFPYAGFTNVTAGPADLVTGYTPTAGISNSWKLAKNLQNNINELRLRFQWPLLPNGLGNSHTVYRSKISGLLSLPGGLTPNAPNYFGLAGYPLYFNNPTLYQTAN